MSARKQSVACGLAAVGLGLLAAAHAPAVTVTITATGDYPPGFGYPFGSMFGSPWLNESGQVAFRADTQSPAPGRGFFRYDARWSGVCIARAGDPAPGGGTFSMLDFPGSLNGTGQVAFWAGLAPMGSGLFRGDGAALVSLARTGDPAPVPGGGWFDMFDTMSYPPLNDAGQAAFKAMVMGGTTTEGVFRADGTTTVAIARQGQAVPGTVGGTFGMLGSLDLNEAGQVSFRGDIMGATAMAGVFRGSGGAITPIVVHGQAAPGTGGGTFGMMFALPALNNAGRVAFRADVMGGASTEGLFLGDGGPLTPIALRGEFVPGGDGKFDMFSQHLLNDAGQVAFQAGLTNTPGGTTDDQGIYRGNGIVMEELVRKGDAAPDGNGVFGMLGGPGGTTLRLAAGGQVAFLSDLTGTAGGGADDRGIFLADALEVIQVARKGQSVPHTSETITNLGFEGMAGPMMGQPNSTLNSFGQVAYWAEYSSGGGPVQAGIFLFTPELHWRGGATGAWDDAMNWTVGLRPAHVHPVLIDPAAGTTVYGPGGHSTIESLTVAPRGGATAGLVLDDPLGHLEALLGVLAINGGTVHLQAGTLTASWMSVGDGGTYTGSGGTLDADYFYLDGGTVTGTLQNQGWFSCYSGTFAGHLLNQGGVSFGVHLTLGDGMTNEAPFTVWSRRLTLNGSGLANSSFMVLRGALLDGNGPLVNTGHILCTREYEAAPGNPPGNPVTIGGSGGFTNHGAVCVQSTDLILSNTGTNTNFGMLDLDGNVGLALTGAGLTNAGTLYLDVASVLGPGALANVSGGLITGTGLISAPFSNAGLVAVDDGMLRVGPPFTNTGILRLIDGAANLTGGAITNAGTIEGHGHVANLVDNTGRIDALGGTLSFSRDVSNLAGGQISVTTGNKVLLTRLVSPNTGAIRLLGGTFETAGPFANAGLITGRGTLLVGGAGLTNTGSLAFSAGLTDVFGDVNNAGGGRIITSGGGTTTFWDDVVHNGAEIRTSAGCTSVFLGSVSGSGPFTGTGTVYFEGDLTPGSSPAAISFGGDVVFTSTSRLEIELGGTAPGTEYDTLTVAGNLSLDGMLDVVLIYPPWRPVHNDRFTVLTFGTRDGDFHTKRGLDLGGRLVLVPEYTPHNLVLTAVQGGSGEWGVDSGGNASQPGNWTGGVPNGPTDTATFGGAITAPRVVMLDQATTYGAMHLDNASAYTLAGPSVLTLEAPAGSAQVLVTQAHGSGEHVVAAPVRLASSLDITLFTFGALTFAGPLDNSAGLAITKTGPGPVVIAGPQTHGPGARLRVDDGTVTLNTDAGGPGTANLTIDVGYRVRFGSTQHLAGLDLGAGWAELAAGGSRTLVTRALAVDHDASLDLADNNLVVDYTGPSPLADICAYVRAGFNAAAGGYWDGFGIMSSAARDDAALLTALGVLDNTDGWIGGKTHLEGEPVDPTSILVKYTYWGDADLDGDVDFDDYDVIDYYYWFPPPAADAGWWTGDFDYDQDIDFDDYDRIDYAYWFQGAPLSGGGGPAPVVPEPATLALAAIGALAALGRGRLARRARA